MTPTPDADIARLALIEATRSQGDAIARMATGMDKLGDSFTQMAQDVAVLKSQDVKNEMALIRQTIDLAMKSHDAKVEASEKAWREQVAGMEVRFNGLIKESQDDRRRLWIENEAIKGKLLPLGIALSFGLSLLAAFLKDALAS